MKVCINGLGNIGTTLALVLNKYKIDLGISEVVGYKNNYLPWQSADLLLLKNSGIEIIYNQNIELAEHLKTVDFIFDTNSNGFALKNKEFYSKSKNLMGAIAQGSENGFGIQYMSGLPIDLSLHKMVQIVSCNTHAAASIINLFGNRTLSNIKSADFVVVRRSEDLGNHSRLVSANVVARHLSEKIGTHHAIDVDSMFAQLGLNFNITSSDITTPSQLMHSTRFHIETKNAIDWEEISLKIKNSNLIASTLKFDSNIIFELGRRYGDFGRIYNHLIIVENNILKTSKSAKGWAFVPQEGNTIISTIDAFLKMTQPKKAEQVLSKLQQHLCKKEW